MAGGRPKKYKTAAEMQIEIDLYFADCDAREKPYTICGLANALGMDRKTVLEYQKQDKFCNTIKKAKMKCQQYAEEYLFAGRNVAGAIFNMKNNYGWKDKTEQEVTGANGGPLTFRWGGEDNESDH